MKLHALSVRLGLDTTPKIATQLLNSYVAVQSPFSLTSAQQLFDQVPIKDVVLWSSLISAYTRYKFPIKALQLFSTYNLQPKSTHGPNAFIYATVAHAITSLSKPQIHLGQSLHAQVIQTGFLPSNVVVATALLDMYSKCGVVDCAKKMFDEMPERNLVTWNAMFAGYVQNGMVSDGLCLFYRMKCCEFLIPDEFSVSTALTASGSIQDLTLGKQLHSFVIITGLFSDCANLICNMYFQCNEIILAERIVEETKSSLSLSLINIRGYIMNHYYKRGLQCFLVHHIKLLEADHTIIVPLLTACTRLNLLKLGKQLHTLLVTSCLSQGDDIIIGCSLIDMYSKCSHISAARNVYDNFGYPHQIPYSNSMINGYVYNGLIQEARAIFEEMEDKTVVSYTSLLTGYIQNNMLNEGIKLLSEMHYIGNAYTFVVGLIACTQLTDLNKGKQIHAKMIRRLTTLDFRNPIIGTTLIDMYAKSASLRYAKLVFDSMSERNVFSWTSIITTYTLHGDSFNALRLFKEMIGAGVKPNEVTFVSVLSACSHSGLVKEGLDYFKMMKEFGLVPSEDHFMCLIDMLGRVGRLNEAWEIVEEVERCGYGSMKLILAAMAGACQMHGDVDLGRRVEEKLVELKEEGRSTHVALSNVYASAGLWEEASKVREIGKKGDLNLEGGISSIWISGANSS